MTREPSRAKKVTLGRRVVSESLLALGKSYPNHRISNPAKKSPQMKNMSNSLKRRFDKEGDDIFCGEDRFDGELFGVFLDDPLGEEIF